MDEWKRESHWGWGQCHCPCGHHSLTSSRLPYWQGWAGLQSPSSVSSVGAQGHVGLEVALNKLNPCQPAGEWVATLSQQHWDKHHCYRQLLPGQIKGNSWRAPVIYTNQQQFSEIVSDSTSPSPCFSSQDGHAIFSEDISPWKNFLLWASSHHIFRSFGPGSWCHLMLCLPSPLLLWLSGRVVCQPFPLRPVWQQNRQASQPQRLPTPLFLWPPAWRVSLTLPLSALPLLDKLTMCPPPHVMLNTKPGCTNIAHTFSIHILHLFSLFDSHTLIHAFTFLGDINTSSYIQNERSSSNSIEIGL